MGEISRLSLVFSDIIGGCPEWQWQWRSLVIPSYLDLLPEVYRSSGIACLATRLVLAPRAVST